MRQVTQSLQRSGLRVLETFDLHDARLGLHNCPCPRHGTTDCDCQMVVLMIYGEALAPTTLTLHGNDGETWISLVSDRAQSTEVLAQAAIERAMRSLGPAQGL